MTHLQGRRGGGMAHLGGWRVMTAYLGGGGGQTTSGLGGYLLIRPMDVVIRYIRYYCEPVHIRARSMSRAG